MKYILFLILLILFQTDTPKKLIFLKKYELEINKVSDNINYNEMSCTIQFNKGNKYKFEVINNVNDMNGLMLFEIKDSEKIIGTNLLNNKYFSEFVFVCNKTTFYDILLKFKDNTTGNSILNIYIIQ